MTNQSATYGAIARGNADAVRELVARDPSVLQITLLEKGWLHWAAQMGHTEIMEVFLKAGLPVDQVTDDGAYTPLKVAAGQGHYKACEWLIKVHADINHGLGNQPTPVFGAIFSKSLKLVNLFVEQGADLTATFGDPKMNVISYAQRYGTPEIVNFLQKSLKSE